LSCIGRFLASTSVFLLLAGCLGGSEDPSALFLASPGDGPVVRVDPLTKYTPEIPFPNDIATVMDVTSPTGRRINTRTFAPTVFEENVRDHLVSLDGFGTFAPISVSFTKPLEISSVKSNVLAPENRKENSVLLLDLGATEPYWGSRLVPLDTENNANFPIHIAGFPFPERNRYFPPYTYGDSPGGRKILSFFEGEETDEQLLYSPDNKEDLDGDGIEETLTFYEKETDTLILRPLIPLRQETEYLVVITKAVTGKEGDSVCSPYPYVAHAAQIPTLQKALAHLSQAHVRLEEIAFCWSFTTQSITPVLEAVRDGMDETGPLAFIRRQVPARLKRVSSVDVPWLEEGNNPYLLDTELLNQILNVIIPLVPEIQGAPLHMDHVDYFVMGSFMTPNFRATHDEIFDIDLNRGTATMSEEEVPFVLSVPKTTAEHQPPFPVTLYCHGNQSVRFEALASADYLAEQGIAVMAIDAVGHGPIANGAELPALLAGAGLDEQAQLSILTALAGLLGVKEPGSTLKEVLNSILSIGFLNEVLIRGRGVDLSGDGLPDNGANFWTADTFKTRDVVRQTVIDLLWLLRILKALTQESVPADVPENPGELTREEADRYLLAGDFNMDGILDVGGADNRYFQSGISLGGIVSSIVLGVEPGITAGVPVVPGGGLTDVMLRSDLKDVMYRIYYEVLGPVIVGTADGNGEDGTVSLKFQNNLREFPAGRIRAETGGRVYGVNLSNGEDKWADVKEGNEFVIGVAADVGHTVRLTSYGVDGTPLDQVDLVSPLKGFGLERNTPRLRRFIGLAQITMDPGDPINYAPHWFLDPLKGVPPKNVLQLTDPGDLTVPINNQIALARAGGLLGDLRGSLGQVLESNGKLIERQVMLGFDPVLDPGDPDFPPDPEYQPFPMYDVDDIDQNNGEHPSPEYWAYGCANTQSRYCTLVEQDRRNPFAPFSTVNTGRGVSLVRFPFAKKHEFFGIPRGPDYAIYTAYAQNQAGCFLGDEGKTWKPEWDCKIVRTEDDTRYGPECPVEWNQ
jgi:hypothetical protein